jgi:hypothetical protein
MATKWSNNTQVVLKVISTSKDQQINKKDQVAWLMAREWSNNIKLVLKMKKHIIKPASQSKINQMQPVENRATKSRSKNPN